MKNKSRISKNFFEDLQPEYEALVNLSVEISDRIEEILNRRGISQKQFAELLGKSESEISKWMSGMHNFTIKSIVNIENVLQEKILQVYRSSANLELRDEIFNESSNWLVAIGLTLNSTYIEAYEKDSIDFIRIPTTSSRSNGITRNVALTYSDYQFEKCKIN